MTILKIFFTDFADFVIIPDVKVCKGYDGPGAIVGREAEDIEPETTLFVPYPHVCMWVCFIVVAGWRY